ncbi:MAG: hypothetical protein Q4F65_03885 [Propionibacteriaceae bacterium]|nr:hypothetical protein [Propionibacteriaceae bacterium]
MEEFCTRVTVAYDPAGPNADRVRTWLLQLGARPVDRAEPGASAWPLAPQFEEVERSQVAAFVHGVRGEVRSPEERFDDHGSAASWPRGSF